MSQSLNKMYLLVGKPGTGKTTIAKQLAEQIGLRTILLDVVKNPSYSELPIVELEQIPYASQTESFRVITPEIEEAMYLLDKHHSNATVICEDCGSYLMANIHENVNKFLKYFRHRNFNVILMFHYMQEVPVKVCMLYNYLFLFKTNDNLTKNLEKYNNWHLIKSYAEKLKTEKDEHKYFIISST